jgi:hypothetical protein
MIVLGLEVVIHASSKYKKALSIIIQIIFTNHFTMKFLSHTLFNFMCHLSIIGKQKKYLKN